MFSCTSHGKLSLVSRDCLAPLWVAAIVHMLPFWVGLVGGLPFFTLSLKVLSKHPFPVKPLLHLLGYLCVISPVASLSTYMFVLDLK